MKRARARLAQLGSAWGAIVLGACQVSGDVLSDSLDGAGGLPGSGGTNAVGPLDTAVDSLATGDGHTCFISLGQLFCVGDGGDGALGSGTLQSQARPLLVRPFATEEPVEVSAGARMTCARSSSGIVACTGAGTSGQLGNGTFNDSAAFVVVPLVRPAIAVSAGHDHVCAILDDSTLWCWGANAEGQLAQADPFPGAGVPAATPLQVGVDADWSAVSGGQGHTCAIRENGSLWCWGRNSTNELGLGDAFADQIRTPTQVGSQTDWKTVEAGQNYTCGVRAGGLVACWGGNEAGQLGTGDREGRDAPTTVYEGGARSLAVNTFHTCVLTATGVECTGRGAEGALGNGTADQPLFEPMAGTTAAARVATGRFHSCVSGTLGLACAGSNEDGRLGVGDTLSRSTLTAVLSPSD